MIEQSRLWSALQSGAGFAVRAALVLATLSSALFFGGTAQAQVTTSSLIGDSVSEVGGNKYADVDEAIKRFGNGDVLSARQFLESAKRKDNNLPPVELLVAKLYFMGQNPNAGRVSLEKTASENPDDPEACLILAGQALQQGRLIEAEALYERGSAITAKFNGNAKRKRNFEIQVRSGKAGVAQRRKNWDAAVADLKALLQTDPDNAGAHYRLGQCLFMQKQFLPGYNEFVAAKKADKDKVLPEPYLAAAMGYDQLKMTSETQQAFDRALAANKTDPVSLSQYAQWLTKSGSADKAETVLNEARKANPGNLNLLILSGVAARMQKKMKPAEEYFVEAHGIAPANVDVINQLALLLIEQPAKEKQERALQFAAIGAQMNNQNADAQITLAWVLFQLERMADANKALQSALQLGNLGPDSSYLLAKMLIAQNRGDTAKPILAAALEADNQGIFIFRKDAEALLQTLPK